MQSPILSHNGHRFIKPTQLQPYYYYRKNPKQTLDDDTTTTIVTPTRSPQRRRRERGVTGFSPFSLKRVTIVAISRSLSRSLYVLGSSACLITLSFLRVPIFFLFLFFLSG